MIVDGLERGRMEMKEEEQVGEKRTALTRCTPKLCNSIHKMQNTTSNQL